MPRSDAIPVDQPSTGRGLALFRSDAPPSSDVPYFSLTGKDKAGEWAQHRDRQRHVWPGAIRSRGAASVPTLGGANHRPAAGADPGWTGRFSAPRARRLVADLAGYIVGPGKFKVGAKLAEAMGR